MENYYEIEEPKKGFSVGKLFKWAILALILFIYLVIVARCMMYKDDKLVEKILVNDITVGAYNQNPTEFTVEEYGMNNAWVAISDGRLVQFMNLYFMPKSLQLQLAVKYNVDLAPDMDKNEKALRFKLVDEDGKEYSDYFFEQKKKFTQNYIRICFNGISLLDESGEVSPETGKPIRKNYTLHIEKLQPDGNYDEVCNYTIYDGSDISRNVSFSLETQQ